MTGFWVEVPRDFVRVSGPDAVEFLQGQLSQEVAGLALGSSAWSFLLQPSGKVDALVRLSREAGDSFVLDVDAGYGEAVVERLERFKLRTKANIERPAWRMVAVREWLGEFDLIGPDPVVEGIPEGTLADYERWRVAAGWPAMGRELTDKTIPAETELVAETVSFTKGCYTGQELVARIDSRGGHVPRHLRAVVFAGDAVPPVGAAVVVDGATVGELTSVVPGIGLAYVGRAVAPPADATVEWDGGSVAARVEAVPR